MTIAKLIKELTKLQETLGPRAIVTVDVKGTQNLAAEDWSHVSVQSVQSEVMRWAKDDSWELKDGSERLRHVVVLNGE